MSVGGFLRAFFFWIYPRWMAPVAARPFRFFSFLGFLFFFAPSCTRETGAASLLGWTVGADLGYFEGFRRITSDHLTPSTCSKAEPRSGVRARGGICYGGSTRSHPESRWHRTFPSRKRRGKIIRVKLDHFFRLSCARLGPMYFITYLYILTYRAFLSFLI